MSTRGFCEFLNQSGFQILRVSIHLTRGNFFVTGTLKAKFANTQPILRAHRWTKNPASHGACLVELAKSSLRIERRARLIIREISEPLLSLFAFVQQACDRVAGEVMRQPGNRFPSALAHASGALWFASLQFGKSLPQSGSIELIDWKRSHAALRAAGTADEPLATSARSLGQRRIHDLNQRLIP
jgi:hypothetical protein